MSIIGSIVAGETVRQVFTLYEDGIAFNGAGFTVTDVLLTSIDGQAVNTATKFGWSNDALGKVYYDPASADFAEHKSPYRVRVKLTDGSNKVRFYPNDGTAEIKVRGQRA